MWALDEERQRTLLTLTPADLDGSVADLAAIAFTTLLAQYGDQLHRNQLIAMRGLGEPWLRWDDRLDPARPSAYGKIPSC